MEVRRAVVGDAPAIGTVVVASWEAAYRGTVPDEVIDRLTVDVRTEQWAEAIASGRTVFVSAGGGTVTGFCSAAPESGEPGVGEVTAIYVDPESVGSGHGRALLAAACEWMSAAGLDGAVLWVLSSNLSARRFYERVGWRTDGAERVDDSFGAPLHLVRYRTRW